jgi:hydroxylamine dehydrogenase
MKRAILIASPLLLLVPALLAVGSGLAQTLAPKAPVPEIAKEKSLRIERAMPPEALACLECHKQENPGLFTDWTHSRHASANITCLDCHRADASDPDVAKEHSKQYERADTKWGAKECKVPIAAVVTPKDCSRCHPDKARQYGQSKHANTIEIIWKIDPWLQKGMSSDFERASGCFHCTVQC